jgi:hypothetical protein
MLNWSRDRPLLAGTSALAFATLGFAVVLHTDFDEVRMFENGLF